MRHNPGRFSQRDANHDVVKGWYGDCHCSVLDLHTLGEAEPGCPDLLIACSGRDELVEIKTEDGDVSESQVKFHREWRGRKVTIVRNQIDVVKHAENIRYRVSRLQA